MKKLLWLLCAAVLLLAPIEKVYAFHSAPEDTTQLIAEDDTSASEENDIPGAPNVYLDCNRCDNTHIRSELTFVNYVRDQERADIHVFVTDQSTGDGGREYEMSFIGRQEFSGQEHTIIYTADRDDTWDEERDGVNEKLRLGLTPYMLQTSLADRFSVSYEAPEGGESHRQNISDPWDYWVFEIYAGRLQTGLESNQRSFNSRWGFYADRVTEDWKFRMRPYFNYNYVSIDQGDDEEPVVSQRHRHGFDSHAIRSITDHWSAGMFGDYITRNDRNLNHRYRMMPGVEYSIFPYEVSTRRSITFRYQVGLALSDYYEMTIFEQTEETLVSHELRAEARVRQTWGNLYGGLVGSHYFHDLDQRRAVFWGGVNVRIMEGLSLNLQADFEMIQDQLSLPAGDASLEEILLEQRELATDFSLSGSIALSYTFGSQFANIVNTRM